MKKLPVCCAALAAALALLLCACAAPAGPAATTTAANLSAFVTAFDLSDLAQYLTGPQLDAVEAAVLETLASRGYASENIALQFGDPAGDSLKLPFDNAGGLDLARLDTAKLADYIADQIALALGAQGITPPTSNTVTTTRAKKTTASTASATVGITTSKPSTTTTTKTAGYTPPERYVIGGNLSRDRMSYDRDGKGFLLEETAANSGKLLPIETAYGNFLIEKGNNNINNDFSKEGLTLYVFYDPEKDGSYNKVGTAKGLPNQTEGVCRVFLVLNPDAKPHSDKKISYDAFFSLGNPNDAGYYKAYDDSGSTSPVRLISGSGDVFQFNGQSVVKISR